MNTVLNTASLKALPELPSHFRAWQIESFGGPEVLKPTEVPLRLPGPGEVLVRVNFCGVCRHDILTRQGAFPHVELPRTPGHQAAGRVVAAGADTSLAVSDQVLSVIFMGCGHCDSCLAGDQARCTTARATFMGDDFDGGYAQFILAPERAFIRLPESIKLEEAAVLSCAYGTALHAVRTRGHIAEGQTIVITGANGGLGSAAISISKILGARSIAVTRSEEHRRRLLDLGASEVLVSSDGTFARRVKELTHGRGANVVLETVGTPTLTESIHAVRVGGRIVVLGNVEGTQYALRPAHLILKELSLTGTKSCSNDELRQVFQWVVDGVLTPEVDQVIDLEQVQTVHRNIETGKNRGRVVLRIDDSPHDGVVRSE